MSADGVSGSCSGSVFVVAVAEVSVRVNAEIVGAVLGIVRFDADVLIVAAADVACWKR